MDAERLGSSWAMTAVPLFKAVLSRPHPLLMAQTSGVLPALYDRVKKTSPKKKKR